MAPFIHGSQYHILYFHLKADFWVTLNSLKFWVRVDSKTPIIILSEKTLVTACRLEISLLSTVPICSSSSRSESLTERLTWKIKFCNYISCSCRIPKKSIKGKREVFSFRELSLFSDYHNESLQGNLTCTLIVIHWGDLYLSNCFSTNKIIGTMGKYRVCPLKKSKWGNYCQSETWDKGALLYQISA